MKDERLKNGELQFITHYTERYSYLDAARMAFEGGCRWVQLRMKDTPVETIEPVALEVQALCRQYGATFIIDFTPMWNWRENCMPTAYILERKTCP